MMGYYDKEQVLQILLHEIYVAVNGNNLERASDCSVTSLSTDRKRNCLR